MTSIEISSTTTTTTTPTTFAWHNTWVPMSPCFDWHITVLRLISNVAVCWSNIKLTRDPVLKNVYQRQVGAACRSEAVKLTSVAVLQWPAASCKASGDQCETIGGWSVWSGRQKIRNLPFYCRYLLPSPSPSASCTFCLCSSCYRAICRRQDLYTGNKEETRQNREITSSWKAKQILLQKNWV